MIKNKYEILETIGRGSFGVVYKGRFMKNGVAIPVAIKFDYLRTSLVHETMILHYLNTNGTDNRGVPKLYWYGNHTDPFRNDDTDSVVGPSPLVVPSCIIISYYKYNLKDFFHSGEFVYSLVSIVQLATKMLEVIQYIHEQGIIHRDIKTCNFMINDDGRVFLIDYGMATTYIDPVTDSHIPCTMRRSKKEIIGSPNYVSLNVHKGAEPTRRDDCISVCYICLWFLFGGKLPWENSTTKEKDKELTSIFANIQQQDSVVYFYEREKPLWTVFWRFFNRCYELKFDEKPPYHFAES